MKPPKAILPIFKKVQKRTPSDIRSVGTVRVNTLSCTSLSPLFFAPSLGAREKLLNLRGENSIYTHRLMLEKLESNREALPYLE
jgi:hypothetical protein